MTDSNQPKAKWYQTNGGIIALLVLFWPVGLYLMWKYATWNSTPKWIITGVLVFLTIVIAADDSDSTQTPPSTNTTPPQAEQTKENTEPASRCEDAPENVVRRIQDGINTEGVTLANAKMVKSNDFESVYFISADLQGSGLEGNSQIATFATNQIDATGLTLSVEHLAEEFSNWPLVSTTDFDITSNSDGVDESQKCVQEIDNTAEEKANSTTPDLIEHISAIIKQQYPNYEVSVWNSDGSFATTDSGPWEIIINSPIGSVSSCSIAKEAVYYSMKTIYTDDMVKDNIDRVLVHATPQVRASLGSVDGSVITKELWESNGPSNTAKALQAAGSSEDESKPNNVQTYWESLGSNNCY